MSVDTVTLCPSPVSLSFMSIVGANDKKYNSKKAGATKLCSLCSGSGSDKCSRSSKESYYGYDGAFKCLKDGPGDVAFIKAAILNALSPADKAKYKLLCMNNTQAGMLFVITFCWI